MALCSIGPRQMTGWSSGTKYPMERHLTPWADVGTTMSPMTTGSWSAPSILGTEKPYTSASSSPTRWPARASAMARLTVTVDLPTPPLPDETPITRVEASGAKKAGVPASRPGPWPCPCPWSCPSPSSSPSPLGASSGLATMSARNRCRRDRRSSSFMTTNSRSTSSTPGTPDAAWWMASASSSRPGQAATGSATSA